MSTPLDPGRLAVFRPEIDEYPDLVARLERHDTVEVVGPAVVPACPAPARLRLGGTLGMFTSRALAMIVCAVADRRDLVELDLDAVVFVGAQACRAIADASRGLRERGGTVVLIGGRPSARRTLGRYLGDLDGVRVEDAERCRGTTAHG